MRNVFDTLRHVFSTVNVTHIVWCAAVLLTMLILAVLHHIWKDDLKKLRLWRLLCIVPLLICAVCKAQDRLSYNRCANRHFVLPLQFLFLCDFAQFFQSFKGKLYQVFSFTCYGYGRTLYPERMERCRFF